MSKFRKKARWLALVPVILLGSLVELKAPAAYCQSEFRKYFEGLASTEASVNPLQRAIFSLMLANSKPHAHAAASQTTTHRL